MGAGDAAMRGAGGGSGRIDRRRIASWQAAAVIAVATVLGIGVPAGAAKAPKEKVILGFAYSTPLGDGPETGLVADGQGNLYGTTTAGGAHGFGAVYELSPPRARTHKWHAKILYALRGGKQGCKASQLTIDPDGNLYGTTIDGGNGFSPDTTCSGYGTVFKLSPPASGSKSWSMATLYAFQHNPNTYNFDVVEPWPVRLYRDVAGNLYGTTMAGGVVVKQGPGGEYVASTCGGFEGQGCGTVFELSPPAAGSTTWKETILHNFVSNTFSDSNFGAIFDGSFPLSGLVMDPSGNLYGTTSDVFVGRDGISYKGMVFELSPPSVGAPGWTETILHGFTGGADSGYPTGALTIDANGNVFGTTSGSAGDCGGVFEVAVPPNGGTPSIEAPLYAFSGPDGCRPQGVNVDSRGNLYGATLAGGQDGELGVAFELSPPTLGAANWTEVFLHTFDDPYNDGDVFEPTGELAMDGAGNLFGTANAGGAYGPGGVFEITPPPSTASRN